MVPRILSIPLLLAPLTLSGCLFIDTSHTLYLDQDGALSWLVVQKDVHSREAEPQVRATEEKEFVDAVRSGKGAVADGFAALAPSELDVRLVRDRRPYMAVTEARFGAVDEALRGLMTRLLPPGAAEVSLARQGQVTTVTLTVHPPLVTDHDDGSEGDEPNGLVSLLAEPESYRILLTSGTFVDATNFELSEGDTIAVPIDPTGPDGELRDPLVYRISWKP